MLENACPSSPHCYVPVGDEAANPFLMAMDFRGKACCRVCLLETWETASERTSQCLRSNLVGT